jgi:hypothetical protein
MSPISYSKDWRHDPFNGRVYLCFSIGLKYGLLSHQLDADAQKLCTIVFPWGKYKYKLLPMGIKIAPDVFQNVMSKLVQGMEYVKTYLDHLLILTNNRFKDHLLKLEIVLARFSTTGMRVNISVGDILQEQPFSFICLLFIH